MKQGVIGFFIGLIWFPLFIKAAEVTGKVIDPRGDAIPYTSVLVKGTNYATTTNVQGVFKLVIAPGKYTFLFRHIGYATQEVLVTVNKDSLLPLQVHLQPQQYELKEVVVGGKTEDPAYGIMRKAIAKAPEFAKEMEQFTCQVYVKGQAQLRNYPQKFLGNKVDFEDGDTAKKKMIFLSESLAQYAVGKNDQRKVTVLATKVSGQNDGFGLANPSILLFYKDVVTIGRGLNPRGFVSPLAKDALRWYRFKLQGSFFENGKEINRIQVIPQMPYEPLFSGYIYIIENDWRLQSADLMVLKQQQLQLLDTLRIQQLWVPQQNTWVLQQQVLQPAGKWFAFDFFGTILQVYSQFNMHPTFAKGYFDQTIVRYADSSNKKVTAYWDSIRPIPLQLIEIADYRKKDSLEQLYQQPAYADSIDKVRNKTSLSNWLLMGATIGSERKKYSIAFDQVVQLLGTAYNTVEGRMTKWGFVYTKEGKGRNSLMIQPLMRYGYGNRHFNLFVNTRYNYGKNYLRSIWASGGHKVFHFNNQPPIGDYGNTASTLLWKHNHLKIYEGWFAKTGFYTEVDKGWAFAIEAQWQKRKPLNNIITTLGGHTFSPNYPVELMQQNFSPHRAFITKISITWKPGSKYVQFPDRKIAIGTGYPMFKAELTNGIQGLLGSNVAYTKWQTSLTNEHSFHLHGKIRYHAVLGGFMNTQSVQVPDYHHFMGSQTSVANYYLTSFQLMPYYRYSNTAKMFAELHVEHHFNGWLSNKIPLLKKWNWFLVAGCNSMYIDPKTYFAEGFIGLENIFKLFRVDYVHGYSPQENNLNGIRLGLPLFLMGRRD